MNMVKPEDKEIYELTMDAYFDLVKVQERSNYVSEAKDCLELLEYFEEFEKCQNLIKIFPHLKS